MTIDRANEYFAALPEGFAPAEELRAALPAAAQQVAYVGTAGTAGKTASAALIAAVLKAAGFVTGLYHAGCEPLAQRIRINGNPVDAGLLCTAENSSAAASPCPARRRNWRLRRSASARRAAVWPWWNCRTLALPRRWPTCRSAW